MVVGSITKYLALGLVGAFLLISLTNPQRALATTQAIGGGGKALGEYGAGFKALFSGLATGGVRLLDPLFTLRDLVYGPQAGVQTPKDVAEVVTTTPTVNTTDIIKTQKNIELSPQSQFEPLPFARPQPSEKSWLDSIWCFLGMCHQGPRSPVGVSTGSPITASAGQMYKVYGKTLPLNQQAINYYNKIGVTVSPVSGQTVASSNAGNATSSRSAGIVSSMTGGRASGRASGGGFGAAN